MDTPDILKRIIASTRERLPVGVARRAKGSCVTVAAAPAKRPRGSTARTDRASCAAVIAESSTRPQARESFESRLTYRRSRRPMSSQAACSLF